MEGPINIWAAGQDALLQQLAARDLQRQQEAELARRAQLDQEAREDRERMREHQEAQLRSLEDDRRERREMAEAGAAATAREKAEKAAQERLKQDAIFAYQNAPNEDEKAKWRERIMLQFPDAHFEKPEKKTGSWRTTVNAKGQPVDRYMEDPDPNTEIPHYVAPRAEPRERTATPAQIAALWPRALSQAQAEAKMTTTGPLDLEVIEARATELREQALIDMELDPAQFPLKKKPPAVVPAPSYLGRESGGPLPGEVPPPGVAPIPFRGGGAGLGSVTGASPIPPPARVGGPGPRAGGPPPAPPPAAAPTPLPTATPPPAAAPATTPTAQPATTPEAPQKRTIQLPPTLPPDAQLREIAISVLQQSTTPDGKPLPINDQSIATVMANIRKRYGPG